MIDNLNEENLEVEDTAVLALKFSKGTLGSLHAGYQLAGSPPGYSGGLYDSHFSIRGTSGYGTIPSNDNIYKFYSETGDLELAGIKTMAFSPSSSAAYGGKAGEYFIETFLKCIVGCARGTKRFPYGELHPRENVLGNAALASHWKSRARGRGKAAIVPCLRLLINSP